MLRIFAPVNYLLPNCSVTCIDLRHAYIKEVLSVTVTQSVNRERPMHFKVDF